MIRKPGFENARLYLALCVLLCICAWSCAKDVPTTDEQKNYKIIHKVIRQPVDHADPGGPKLPQQIDILIPDGAPLDAPVFFNLGNETDLTEKHLLKFYELHGERNDIIYIQAEHRGYGQSLTENEDQSVPSYVRIEQVLADTHEVIVQLKENYSGPWMAAGWSYGGGLVIEFAHKHPEDVAVILSSSGVVDWPFLDYGYDRQVKVTLGEACYKRLARHSNNLEPKELFDKNWLEREFLQGAISGVVQFPSLKKLQPYFKMLTFLPTGIFIKVMHRLDDKFGDGEAWNYALASGTKKMGREEVAAGLHNWHVWRYQECTEIGGFLSSEEPDALFSRTHDNFCEECHELFGEDPPYAKSPERDDPDLAREVLAEMLKYARPES
jgi:pimeloyl-ACP methyl ester carboxylesterase